MIDIKSNPDGSKVISDGRIKFFLPWTHQIGDLNQIIFKKICSVIDLPIDGIIANPFTRPKLTEILDTFDFQTKTVIICVDDHMRYPPPNEWSDPPLPYDFDRLLSLVKSNTDKFFIFLFEGYYLSTAHFDGLPNVVAIGWTPLYEHRSWPKASTPIKNLSSDKVGICLNRQMRMHRISLISLLHGLGLDRYIHMSALHMSWQEPVESILQLNNWQFEQHHYELKSVMIDGYDTVKALYENHGLYDTRWDICELVPGTISIKYLSNFKNYQENLLGLYSDSFVEFITCTLFDNPHVSLDEKIIQSVYGMNLPIIIGSKGTVALYRRLGFDMFDDVIDHSYDQMDHPFDRLTHAVLDNQHLLKDADLTKKIWSDNQGRFRTNIDHARKNYYLEVTNRVLDDLATELKDERFAKARFTSEEIWE